MSLVFVQLCVGTSQCGEDEEMGEQIVDGGMGKRTRSGEGVGGQNFGKEGNLIVFPFILYMEDIVWFMYGNKSYKREPRID